jgi:hypothetical protein
MGEGMRAVKPRVRLFNDPTKAEVTIGGDTYACCMGSYQKMGQWRRACKWLRPGFASHVSLEDAVRKQLRATALVNSVSRWRTGDTLLFPPVFEGRRG